MRRAGVLAVVGGAIALVAVIGGVIVTIGTGGSSGPVFVDGARSYAGLAHDHPLTHEDRADLTAEGLAAMTQHQRGQIYARLAAGPQPTGVYESRLLGDPAAALAGLGTLPADTAEFLDQASALAWAGERVFTDDRVQSASDDFSPVQVMINRVSAIEGVRPDYRNFPVVEVPRSGLLSIIFSTTSAYAMFPARVYCGASLADPRAESHVIDHRRNEMLAEYRPIPDVIAGHRGLALREEVRQVRSGLYLGRAYSGGVALGDVILSRDNDGEAENGAGCAGGPRPMASG